MGKKGAIQVLLVEDNPYARDVMMMLLVRDWRTQVVGEATTTDNLANVLESLDAPIDFFLIDTEHPIDLLWPYKMATHAREIQPNAGILLTSTHIDANTLSHTLNEEYHGYLINAEILYGLPWAIVLAAAGHWVTTPSVVSLAKTLNLELPRNTIVLNGKHIYEHLRPREQDVSRLAVLFNLRRADVADELGIGEGQVNKHVSDIYSILGLTDILKGSDSATDYFDDRALVERFEAAKKKAALNNRGGTREKATLAFHLLTTPLVNKLNN